MARTRSRRGRVLGAVAEPRTAERAYMRSLRSLSRHMHAVVLDELEPLLEAWPAPRGDDGGAGPTPAVVVTREVIDQVIGAIRVRLGRVLREEQVLSAIDSAGKGVSRHTLRELRRVLAIDLRADLPGVQSLIDGWRERNVALIESSVLGPADGVKLRPLLDDISELVEGAHAQGLRVEVLRDQLEERFGVSERRAELIARDQVLTLNSQINRHRQQSAGVTQYRWRTVRDERVRPRHAELDGSVQSWNAPPEVAPGRFEHPGGDVQCRCQADPVLPDWLDV